MSLLRKAFATAAALVMIGTLTGTAHAEEHTAWVQKKTGKCLSVRAADDRDGAPVFQFDCSSYDDQFWHTRPAPLGGVRFVNNKTGRCMAVRAADNRDGAPVFQYGCRDDYKDQTWEIRRYDALGGGYAYSTVRNLATGKCLTLWPDGSGNGTQAVQHTCDLREISQRWVKFPH